MQNFPSPLFLEVKKKSPNMSGYIKLFPSQSAWGTSPFFLSQTIMKLPFKAQGQYLQLSLDLTDIKVTQATKYTEAVKFIIHIYLIYTELSR